MNNPIINLDRYKREQASDLPSIRLRPRRSKANAPFLRGPIPWDWLVRAAYLPGKALHISLAAWFWVGIRKTNGISLSTSKLSQLGVKRHAAYRGLAALEAAGLVSVVRKKGRNPLVTIIQGSTNRLESIGGTMMDTRKRRQWNPAQMDLFLDLAIEGKKDKQAKKRRRRIQQIAAGASCEVSK